MLRRQRIQPPLRAKVLRDIVPLARELETLVLERRQTLRSRRPLLRPCLRARDRGREGFNMGLESRGREPLVLTHEFEFEILEASRARVGLAVEFVRDGAVVAAARAHVGDEVAVQVGVAAFPVGAEGGAALAELAGPETGFFVGGEVAEGVVESAFGGAGHVEFPEVDVVEDPGRADVEAVAASGWDCVSI